MVIANPSLLGARIQSSVMNFIKTERTLNTKLILNKEWTVLAAFIAEERKTGDFKVVAVGSGTKSIGRNKIDSDGRVLIDCHAEVLARRSL